MRASTFSAWRLKDTARWANPDQGPGRPAIDANDDFPGGSEGTGRGRASLHPRQSPEDFLDNFTQVVVYALEPLPHALRRTTHRADAGQMAANISLRSLVETIVTSPQFLNKRVRAMKIQAHSER